MTALNKIVGALVLVIVAFSAGWIAASDYGDRVAVGTYQFKQGRVASTLVLKGDHTFDQELTLAEKTLHATGSWRRVGEGGISLSREFLVVPGQEPEPDGTTFADVHKTFGLFVSLQLREYHVLWYGRRSSSADKAPSGVYEADEPGAAAMLTLEPDHSFDQKVVESGSAHHAKGTWSVGPHGNISFSKEFLKTSGAPLGEDESAVVDDPQASNLQIRIANVSRSGTPIFRKRLIPW
jgi:hypothetical protein